MSFMHPLLVLAVTNLCFAQPAMPLDLAGDPLPKHAIARMGTQRLRHGDKVTGVCFSRDEKSLFSAGGDNAVRQWDVTTGKLLRELTGHEFCFHRMAISPDGQLLAAAGGSADCRVYLWDAVTGKLLDEIKGESAISDLKFSPDSKTLAWVTLENRLVFWDRATKTKKAIGLLSFRASHCLAYSPSGAELAVGDDGGSVRLMEADSGKFIRQWKLKKEHSSVECIRYSHDGTKIATAGGLYCPIQIWDAKSGDLLQTMGHQWQLDYSIGFSPDDKTLVSQRGAEVILWDVATGTQRKQIPLLTGIYDYATDFAFSRDGKLLAIAHDGNAITLLDIETGKLRLPMDAHRVAAARGEFMENGRTIVSSSSDGFRFWNAETGQHKRHIFCGKTYPVSQLLTADGKTIVWGAGHKTIHCLDIATGKETQVLNGHEVSVHSIALAADGNRLLSAAGTILKLWDLANGKNLVTRDCEYSTHAMESLPDGKRFLLACNGLEICDSETLETIGKFDGVMEAPWTLRLSADGKRLATSAGGLDNAIRVWDIDSRRQTSIIEAGASIGALAIAADGKRLAFTHTFEPKITVWDIGAKKVVRSLRGHVGPVYSLTFSVDGTRLISSGADTTLMVWDISKAK